MSDSPVSPPEGGHDARGTDPMPSAGSNDETMSEWQAAYRDHGPAVLAFLASRTRRREDAEDLLQETFVRAIRAADRLRDRSKLRSYLLTTAHNLMVNAYRRKRVLLFSEGGEATEDLAEKTVAGGDAPDARARIADLEAALARVREGLSPALRTAFDLAILKQESYDEIARQTGWSPGQVRINVFRTRRRLVEELGDLLPLPESDD